MNRLRVACRPRWLTVPRKSWMQAAFARVIVSGKATLVFSEVQSVERSDLPGVGCADCGFCHALEHRSIVAVCHHAPCYMIPPFLSFFAFLCTDSNAFKQVTDRAMPFSCLQRKGAPKSKAGQKGKKTTHKFVLDCTTAETDSILDVGNFEKYLKERIKVNGKAGALGDAVTVGKDKSKIVITSENPFSKRYLKYLSKKYLKKHQVPPRPLSPTRTRTRLTQSDAMLPAFSLRGCVGRSIFS